MFKSVCKKLGMPILLFIAFYAGGHTGSWYEHHYNDIVMSCAVFTATFSAIVAGGAKLYHIFFI